ncbi:WD40-repeat-containing domain protein [Mucidula mucida]|nr:WD40-repeat-containing domain protein [Mucidula mucida]
MTRARFDRYLLFHPIAGFSMTATPLSTITINSEEINLLIYSYLLDCGFTHSAFTICQEGHLERSPKFKKHIPRGELAELLSKSLLYSEVESHYRGGETVAQCRASFSLLEPHKSLVNAPHAISITKPIPQPTVLPRRLAEEAPPTSASDMVVDSVPAPAQESAEQFINPAEIDIMISRNYASRVFVCLFNPANSQVMATGSKNAELKIWTLPYPMDTAQFSVAPANVYFGPAQNGVDITSLHWNSEGSLVAVACYDATLRLITLDGRIHSLYKNHEGPIFTTRFSPNGKYLLSASLDGSTCLYDVAKKALKRRFKSHKDCVLDIIWLNNTTFASAGADSLIYIQDIETAAPIKTLSGHANEINQIRLNAAGTRLASCSDDKTSRVWDITNLSAPTDDTIPGLSARSNRVVVLAAHDHAVTALAWCESKKSSIIATGSFDATTRLWDSTTGQCLRVIREFSRPVYAVSASQDGEWFAAAGANGNLRVYNVEDNKKSWTYTCTGERPGIFDIDWRTWDDGKEFMAISLEDHNVVVFDVKRLKAVINGTARK